MKIAILYELLGRSRGGIEAWIYHACEELVSQGHEVTVFNTQVYKPTDALPKNAKEITLNPTRKIPGIYFLNHFYSLKKQLKDKLKKYDVVWARSFTMALAASNISKKKVIYINAAPYSYYDGQVTFKEHLRIFPGFLGFLRILGIELSLKISWVLERKAINRCVNVYLSYARRDQTLAFFKLKFDQAKFFVIPAGVNSKQFFPTEVGWNGIDTLQLISVCRLSPDKNIQCVIYSVAKLVQDRIPIRLTIVGEGHFEGELRKIVNDLEINEYINFVGRQENIEKWYRQSHVFVLPSLYEGFGSVYIEAMACGLPCIAISRKSGIFNVATDEIIDDGITGLLMKENNHLELALLIKLLFENPQMLSSFSKEARRKVINKFTWENTINKLLLIEIQLNNHL